MSVEDGNSSLADEVTSINAIYGEGTLAPSDESLVYILQLPTSSTSLRISFPEDYPVAPPAVLGPHSTSADSRKGEGNETAQLAREALGRVYQPDQPCIFDLIEELQPLLESLAEPQEPASNVQAASDEQSQHDYTSKHDDGIPAIEPPPWTLSEVVTEKKSIFVARATRVSSVDEAKLFIRHLLATDKKAARATHNITAWRIRSSATTNTSPSTTAKTEAGVTYQDCDDDGETAAGSRVLHLLQLMDVWDVVVVVTRWYGGVHLGPDRFRIINAVARDAVVQGGFGGEEKGAKGR